MPIDNKAVDMVLGNLIKEAETFGKPVSVDRNHIIALIKQAEKDPTISLGSRDSVIWGDYCLTKQELDKQRQSAREKKG